MPRFGLFVLLFVSASAASLQSASAGDFRALQAPVAQQLESLGSGIQDAFRSFWDRLGQGRPPVNSPGLAAVPQDYTGPAGPIVPLKGMGDWEALATISVPTADASNEAMCVAQLRMHPTDAGFTYSSDRNCLQFVLKNTLSPRINPQGERGYTREFVFGTVAGSRQEEVLHIHETSVGATDSESSMETEITFIPRFVLPAIRLDADRNRYVVTLPTGEAVEYDAKTKETVEGVLTETAPIDLSPNRFTRTFAGLRYTGKGITIRSDQRAETTRGAIVWGQQKKATLEYQGKKCVVSPAELWSQTLDYSPFLFPTDEAFYQFVQQRCGWTVDAGAFADLKTAAQIKIGG